MRIEGNLIIFKSAPDNFLKELNGLKCCTIRRISLLSEMKDFERFYNTYWTYTELPKIKIFNSTTDESFTRTISDISEFEGLWVISWRHDE